MSFTKHVPLLQNELQATQEKLFTDDNLTSDQVIALLDKGMKLNGAMATLINLQAEQERIEAKRAQDKLREEKKQARIIANA